MYHLSQLFFLSLLYLHSLSLFIVHLREIPYGLAVSIPGFHSGRPGSTPGVGTHFFSVQTLQVLFLVFILSTEAG